MRKILPYILIFVIMLQLFAPFTFSVDKNNNLQIETNKAEAEESIKLVADAEANDTSISVGVRVSWGKDGWRTNGGVTVMLVNRDLQVADVKQVDLKDLPKSEWTTTEKLTAEMVQVHTERILFSDLLPETEYGISSIASLAHVSWWNIAINSIGGGLVIPDISTSTTSLPNPLKVTTREQDQTTFVPAGEQVSLNDEHLLPECDILSARTWLGCFGRFVYWAIFQPTAKIFALTGRLLDVSVDYSTKDSSYRSAFVVEGWRVLKDFCNMFFIFVLLYIAFGTILNLNGVKTKEMIINVVIIGLLINFSLFATQIIIDTSNILTRVFYNSNTIKVGPKIEGEIKEEKGTQGEIKLSEALVSKINPHRLLIDSAKVGIISTKQSVTQEQTDANGVSGTTFLLVAILASVVNIVGLVVFLTVSVIFIARVIGLWLAMIFAPLAFFSYIIPAMQDWEMVGWKRWWSDTIKMAFLAPVFIFFIYLIIKFLETNLGLNINDEKGGLDFLLGVFMPFIFIMILLWKAKDIAKNMSGKIGQTMVSAASKIGGVALGAAGGAALGLGAMGLRSTVGRVGNKIATSSFVKENGKIGRGIGNVGKWMGGGSMDVRGVKVGGKSLADTGVNFGKAKEGGYAKHLSDKVKRKQERAKELEVSENEPLKQALNKTEMDLQKLLSENKKQLDSLDKTIEIKRQALSDITSQFGGGSTQAITAGKELQDAKDAKTTFRKTTKADGQYTFVDELGVTRTEDRTIENLERYEIKDRKNDVEDENRKRRSKYARSQAWWGGRANKEAEHKIIMDMKLDSGTKT